MEHLKQRYSALRQANELIVREIMTSDVKVNVFSNPYSLRAEIKELLPSADEACLSTLDQWNNEHLALLLEDGCGALRPNFK